MLLEEPDELVVEEEPALGEAAEVDDELAVEEESDEELEAPPPAFLLDSDWLDSDLPDSDLPASDLPVSADFASPPLFVAGDFAPDLA